MNDITVEELKLKLDAGEDFIFIDVRQPSEYQEFNLNAELIPLGNLTSTIDDFGYDKDKELVVHCRSGGRSARAQAYLNNIGFTNVRNLTGGVNAWLQTYGK